MGPKDAEVMWLSLLQYSQLQCFIEERLCPQRPLLKQAQGSGPLKGFTAPVQLPLWATLQNAGPQGSCMLEIMILHRFSYQREQIVVKNILNSFLPNPVASCPPHTLIHRVGACASILLSGSPGTSQFSFDPLSNEVMSPGIIFIK